MTRPAHFHHRKSIRLKGFDYTQPGAYFVTIAAWQREPLFAEVVDGKVLINPSGKVLDYYWNTLPLHFPVEIDAYVIMPNHIHAILFIVDPGVGAKRPEGIESLEDTFAPGCFAPTRPDDGRPRGTIPGSLGAIVQNFKSNTTREINRLRQKRGIPVWQRNYYERVIRNDSELDRIRLYIQDNPRRWAEDEENPSRTR